MSEPLPDRNCTDNLVFMRTVTKGRAWKFQAASTNPDADCLAGSDVTLTLRGATALRLTGTNHDAYYGAVPLVGTLLRQYGEPLPDGLFRWSSAGFPLVWAAKY